MHTYHPHIVHIYMHSVLYIYKYTCRHVTYSVCWLLLTNRELPSHNPHGKVRKIQRQKAKQTKASKTEASGFSALPLSSLPTVVDSRAEELGPGSERPLSWLRSEWLLTLAHLGPIEDWYPVSQGTLDGCDLIRDTYRICNHPQVQGKLILEPLWEMTGFNGKADSLWTPFLRLG